MKIPWQYSRQVFTAFGLLFVTYIITFWMLWGLQHLDGISFTTTITDDILPLITSLPFVAFYIIVFIAATAGFARGAVMAKELPFGKIMQAELKKRTMKQASIATKIRSGATVKMDTPFIRALDTVITARLPILAVVGDNQKVEGVITNHDIIERVQQEIERVDDTSSLGERLAKLKVRDLNPRQPDTVTNSTELSLVVDRMIKNQRTKLIVLKDDESKIYAGTVDVLDITGEIFEDTETD